MTKDELELRRARLEWDKDIMGAHLAYQNQVLELMAVSGKDFEACDAELKRWFFVGIPFQETIDAYTRGEPPQMLVSGPGIRD